MLMIYISNKCCRGGMDLNIEIIKAVLSNSHTAPRLREISNYYAPNFIYKSPFRKGLNFEEYCQNLALVRASTEFKIVRIEDVKCCYEVMMDIFIFHGSRRKRSKLSANVACFFNEGLIQMIKVKYKATPLQAAYILGNTVAFSVMN